jgi:hypothetical protein
MAMMAITTSSSISVKPEKVRFFFKCPFVKSFTGEICRLAKRLSTVNRAKIETLVLTHKKAEPIRGQKMGVGAELADIRPGVEIGHLSNKVV